jgi:hypothetical protein
LFAIDRWTRERFGLSIVCLEVPAGGVPYMPDVEHMMSGMGNRGLRHAVVARRGEMIHDPHPSRAGLLDVDRIYLFVPVVLPVGGSLTGGPTQ